MIEVRQGNVLDIPQGVIVHGCNCQGVMGGGIALQIKQRFPTAYLEYRRVFESESNANGFCGLKLGKISYAVVEQFADNNLKMIVNANTQHLFGRGRRQTSYDAVAECFENVVLLLDEIRSQTGVTPWLFFPEIGAGLGGGDWRIIEQIIDCTVPDEFKKVLYRYIP